MDEVRRRVLEQVDFTSPDLTAALTAEVARAHPGALPEGELAELVREVERVGGLLPKVNPPPFPPQDLVGAGRLTNDPLAPLRPRTLRDFLAKEGEPVIARTRYRVFGKFETCPLPPAEWRDRFLE